MFGFRWRRFDEDRNRLAAAYAGPGRREPGAGLLWGDADGWRGGGRSRRMSRDDLLTWENDKEFNPFIDVQVFGLLNKASYLDLIKNFIVFETRDNKTIKKMWLFYECCPYYSFFDKYPGQP